MNVGTVALLLAGVLLLSNKSDSMPNISGLLNDNARSVMDSVGKLSDPNASKEQRTGALLEMMTNPTVMEMAEKLFSGNSAGAKSTESTPREDQDVNSEGYNLGRYSDESREFFRPIEKVAGKEVSHKLYSLYDNRYPRKKK